LDDAKRSIRSPGHAAALIGILQLASGYHNGGIVGAIGHNNRQLWFNENIDVLFDAGGPLENYQPISAKVLIRHFRIAQTLARSHYDRDHSNDPTGAEQENIPRWAREFFRFFEATRNASNPTAQAARAREEHNSVAASIVGRQAPLGARAGGAPVQLLRETARGRGPSSLRQQVVGQVNAERVADEEVEVAIEGRNDSVRRTAAPRRTSGVRRRNVHVRNFAAGESDPSSRFASIQEGYSSLNRLTDAIAHSFVAPHARATNEEAPRRTLVQIAREITEVSGMLTGADNDMARHGLRRILDGLNQEIEQAVGNTGDRNKDSQASRDDTD